MVALGAVIVKFTGPIARTVGQNDLAERYLGMGGTYTMWTLIGVGLIIASFFVLTGDLPIGLPNLPVGP
jgi:hypothetical protein